MLGWKLLSLVGALGVTAAAVAPTLRPSDVKVEIAIGKSIENNNPVDTGSTFPASVGTLVCWTRVTGAAAGSKITHVWVHGSDSTSIDVNVGGSPWRTNSKKMIPASGSGSWTVEVKDASGAVIGTKTFTISG